MHTKKANTLGAKGQNAQDDDMAPEYDFSGGERGNYAEAMRNGYMVIVHRTDETTEVHKVIPSPGTVVLHPES